MIEGMLTYRSLGWKIPEAELGTQVADSDMLAADHVGLLGYRVRIPCHSVCAFCTQLLVIA